MLTVTNRDLKIIREMAPHRSVSAIARRLGVHHDTVKRWAARYRIALLGRADARIAEGVDHPHELRAKVVALKGKMSASQIARKFNLASRCVVIGLWDRA